MIWCNPTCLAIRRAAGVYCAQERGVLLDVCQHIKWMSNCFPSTPCTRRKVFSTWLHFICHKFDSRMWFMPSRVIRSVLTCLQQKQTHTSLSLCCMCLQCNVSNKSYAALIWFSEWFQRKHNSLKEWPWKIRESGARLFSASFFTSFWSNVSSKRMKSLHYHTCADTLVKVQCGLQWNWQILPPGFPSNLWNIASLIEKESWICWFDIIHETRTACIILLIYWYPKTPPAMCVQT